MSTETARDGQGVEYTEYRPTIFTVYNSQDSSLLKVFIKGQLNTTIFYSSNLYLQLMFIWRNKVIFIHN